MKCVQKLKGLMMIKIFWGVFKREFLLLLDTIMNTQCLKAIPRNFQYFTVVEFPDEDTRKLINHKKCILFLKKKKKFCLNENFSNITKYYSTYFGVIEVAEMT